MKRAKGSRLRSGANGSSPEIPPGLEAGTIRVQLPDALANAIRNPIDPYFLLGQKEAALAQKDRALGEAILALKDARDRIIKLEEQLAGKAAREVGSRG